MSEPITIHGPVGKLDGRLHGPADGAPIIVMHPHSLYGGTKGTRLVYAICDALAEAGMQPLRFDFRGVGASAGAFDQGVGETEDAAAVWDHLRAATGQDPALVGFSFGGAVAARLAALRPAPRLVMVATPDPVRDSTLAPSEDLPRVSAHCHLVWGTEDEHVPREAVARMQAAAPDLQVHVLEGADHFLTPTHHARAVEAVLRALAD